MTTELSPCLYVRGFCVGVNLLELPWPCKHQFSLQASSLQASYLPPRAFFKATAWLIRPFRCREWFHRMLGSESRTASHEFNECDEHNYFWRWVGGIQRSRSVYYRCLISSCCGNSCQQWRISVDFLQRPSEVSANTFCYCDRWFNKR